MNLQYLHDISGNTTGIFIPIKAWNQLKAKYKELENLENEFTDIHQWQKDIINQRLKNINDGKEKIYDFDKAIDEIEKEL